MNDLLRALVAAIVTSIGTGEPVSPSNGADALVARALACEETGDLDMRAALLAEAVALRPDHAGARGMLGQVLHEGGWLTADEVAARLRADADGAAKRAAYEGRRARSAETAGAQAELAAWCRANGLEDEATAHLRAVTRLAPVGSKRAASAWTRLGYRLHEGQWRTEAEIAADRDEDRAQAAADRRWSAELERLRARLNDGKTRDAADRALSRVTDPRAVPAACAVFGTRSADDQRVAARLLGQIASPSSSRALVALAVYGGDAEVRRAAIETLRGRAPGEFVGSLVGLLGEPILYKAVAGDGLAVADRLILDAGGDRVERIYATEAHYAPGANFRGRAWIADDGLPAVVAGRVLEQLPSFSASDNIARIDGEILKNRAELLRSLESAKLVARMRLFADIEDVEARNKAGRTAAEWRVLPVLRAATGQDFGPSQKAWATWWYDQRGYRLRTEPAPTRVRREVVMTSTSVRIDSCFAAGTPIRTPSGLRPIESLKVGDRVLSGDATTAALAFRPILAVMHNPPAETLRLRIGDDAIVATGYHRFRRAGGEWVMARDLRKGDRVRTASAVATVESIEPAPAQPVFNLEVDRTHSFFVGRGDALVHDNNPPDDEARP